MSRSGLLLSRRLSVSLIAVVVASLAVLPATSSSAKVKPKKKDLAHIQLLTFNDFHGNLVTGGTIPTSYQLNPDGSPVLNNGRPVANTVEPRLPATSSGRVRLSQLRSTTSPPSRR